MVKEKETKVEEGITEKEEKEVQEVAKEITKEVEVKPEETSSQKIDRELREKNQEIADLRKKQQENLLDSERVAITEHKHCVSCGRVFWNEDVQIKSCLVCNPQRQTS